MNSAVSSQTLFTVMALSTEIKVKEQQGDASTKKQEQQQPQPSSGSKTVNPEKFISSASLTSPDKKKASGPSLTTFDVLRALVVYFCGPLLFLAAASAYHDHFDTTTGNVWLLGFATSRELWITVYDRILSVSCWGLTFVFVRKGCNPATRHRFLSRYWKGAVLTTLSVFYSTSARILLQRHAWVRACRDAAPHRGVVDAVLVGVTWATANALIRRRLDPRVRRIWWHDSKTHRDIFWGGLSFAASAYGKSVTGPSVLPSLRRYCRLQFGPVLPAIVTQATSFFFNVSPDQFWTVAIHACHTGVWYGVTYLLIRRGCNPDSRPNFVHTHGVDALWGSLALVVCAYLKLAMSKWLPVALAVILHRPMDTTAGGMDDEL